MSEFNDFCEKYAIKLNDRQAEAVRAIEGPVLLLAVPGSGKTTVLVARLGYMILCKGIKPSHILAMTYTRAATADMKRRFLEKFGEKNAERLEIRTINGVADGILRTYGRMRHTSPFRVISSDERRALIAEIYSSVCEDYPDEGVVADAGNLISYIKNMMLSTPEEISKLGNARLDIYKLYTEYQRRMTEIRRMDYDDQLVYALRVMRRYPDVRDEVRRRFTYICVDEAQDTSRVQHELIAAIARPRNNIFMVGDEDQSIFSFRAAYPKALLDFTGNFKNALTLKIEQNYRSLPEITALANAFIASNRDRYNKSMVPTRSGRAEVSIKKFITPQAAEDFVFDRVCEADDDTAFLYRINENIIPLVDRLEREGVPYRLLRAGEVMFFSRRTVRDVCDILRLALDPYDRVRFSRVYSRLGLYISRDESRAAMRYSEEHSVPVIDALGEIKAFRGESEKRYKGWLALLSRIPKMSADRAIDGIVHSGSFLGDEHPEDERVSQYRVLSAISEHSENAEALLLRMEELRALMAEPKNDRGGPVISTVHSSKGLEYKSVYIADLKLGSFPLDPPVSVLGSLEEEERRLFYVALTRAKDKLCLVSTDKPCSPFVTESEKHLERIYGDERMTLKATERRAFFAELPLGQTVEHRDYGEGQIIAADKYTVTVRFSKGDDHRFWINELIKSGSLKRK